MGGGRRRLGRSEIDWFETHGRPMLYRCYKLVALVGLVCFLVPDLFPQESLSGERFIPVHLQVDAGIPLRLYLTSRTTYRLGEPVHAKVMDPVWAFDRVVIPDGATVDGRVTELEPVSKTARTLAIVGGDFTPLKFAKISFTSLHLPNGRTIVLQTEPSVGLPLLYTPPRPPKKNNHPKPNAEKGKTASQHHTRQFLRQQLENQAKAQANARSHGLYDLVRGPNKREWIENYLLSKSPYHPQWYRSRTRFDAVLRQQLDFGLVDIKPGEGAATGSEPAPGAVGEMAMLKTVSSADARVGDPVESALSKPLFTPGHRLLLPQGTQFTGRVTLAKPAGMFHRGGKLRFAIERVVPPEVVTRTDGNPGPRPVAEPVQGQLVAAESDPKTLKVDAEGTATATESKSRLLRPVIAALVAAKSLDNDTGKQTATGTGNPNAGGRALGGFSGFGLLGMAASYGPHFIGPALGFYGLAFSVYSNVISRGGEVTFAKNTPIAIQFGSPRKK
jgi:hypothetical protein